MTEQLGLFFSTIELWKAPLIAGGVMGLVCGFLGLYVILHRIVFFSAAMSEVSSVGVIIAIWLAQLRGLSTSHPAEDILPLCLAAIFAGIFSAAMSTQTSITISDRSKSSESLIGAIYLMSASLLLIVGDRVTRGAMDVANVLFGNAVYIDKLHLFWMVALCLPIFGVHLWLRKDLLFVAFDPNSAKVAGYPVRSLRLFLLGSLGVVISIGTRTIGALPVFAFTVLAPIAALALVEDLNWSFLISALIGGLAAVLGFLASFLFSLPTGACMTAAVGLFAFLAVLGARVFGYSGSRP